MKYLVANTPIKLAVVGDLCLDLAYRVTTDGAETSVETGLQGYSVLQSTSTLGGACNVALNCRNLNADEVDLYGIVGNDLFSSVLHRLTVDAGIRVEGVITQDENWSTHVYHKVFEGDREHPRFDSGNFNLPSNESIELLFRRLEENIERYDAVIINEQVPQGVHNSFFQERMLALIASYPDVLWIADCRKLNEVYKDVIHKLNEDEGRRIIDYKGDDKSELASRLYRYFNKPVVMTLGENGAIVATEDETVRLDGLHLGGRIDSVGAGDAFLGAFAVTVSRGASLVEAAAIANVAASVSLKVLFGCGNPTVEEVIALAQVADYRYNPEVAADCRKAKYYLDTPIEILSDISSHPFPKVAIFDHDGTISVLRQGWEVVMQKMMMSVITGKQYKNLSSSALQTLETDIANFISTTTGIQTIEQMYYLVTMIQSYGYVPEDELLTAVEYKEIYNTNLLSMVEKRVNDFENGRLSIENVTIKGSVEFLHYLHERGVQLYLASGTDQADVEREASLLGYGHLFEGRIFGSLGRIDADPKRVVIQDIIASLSVQPNACVIFGDGPVEMREGKKHGLLSVGVLSDEVRRYGANYDKRSRLILGGASVLIPDFSYQKELLSLLGWEV